jgi:hypothetical protein
MSTQRQRARNAAVVAAAREAESAVRSNVARVAAPGETQQELPQTGRYPTVELLAQSIADSLDATAAPLSAPGARAGVNDGLRALIDGSAIDVQSVVATADRFAGQPPAAPSAPLRHSIGSFRFRSKLPK